MPNIDIREFDPVLQRDALLREFDPCYKKKEPHSLIESLAFLFETPEQKAVSLAGCLEVLSPVLEMSSHMEKTRPNLALWNTVFKVVAVIISFFIITIPLAIWLWKRYETVETELHVSQTSETFEQSKNDLIDKILTDVMRNTELHCHGDSLLPPRHINGDNLSFGSDEAQEAETQLREKLNGWIAQWKKDGISDENILILLDHCYQNALNCYSYMAFMDPYMTHFMSVVEEDREEKCCKSFSPDKGDPESGKVEDPGYSLSLPSRFQINPELGRVEVLHRYFLQEYVNDTPTGRYYYFDTTTTFDIQTKKGSMIKGPVIEVSN
jgi:hypothetical protein